MNQINEKSPRSEGSDSHPKNLKESSSPFESSNQDPNLTQEKNLNLSQNTANINIASP